ncbi:MAG: GatB/YqeY domain-containing protein [Erysipelotrichaceae bacterium]|nr:GatB/YqeY domain-containing protein [Erysipelotrichaceae bacterium]
MIVNKLKADNIKALKAKDKTRRSILSVILNKIANLEIELRAKQKEITDADVNQILLKTAKELNDELDGYNKVNNEVMINEIKLQLQILDEYLPKMLSEAEIRAEINKLEDKSLPNVMKYFKINFAGQVDMRLVSEIARSL